MRFCDLCSSNIAVFHPSASDSEVRIGFHLGLRLQEHPRLQKIFRGRRMPLIELFLSRSHSLIELQLKYQRDHRLGLCLGLFFEVFSLKIIIFDRKTKLREIQHIRKYRQELSSLLPQRWYLAPLGLANCSQVLCLAPHPCRCPCHQRRSMNNASRKGSSSRNVLKSKRFGVFVHVCLCLCICLLLFGFWRV